MEKFNDWDYGTDCRGDYALFIEEANFDSEWELTEDAKDITKGMGATFFRVIRNGEQTSSHGWIEDAEIVQWG